MPLVVVKFLEVHELVRGRVQHVALVPVLRHQLYVSEIDAGKPVLYEVELIRFDLEALDSQHKVSGLRRWLEPSIAYIFVELTVLEVAVRLPGHRRVRSHAMLRRSMPLLLANLEGVLPHVWRVIGILLLPCIPFAI